MDGLLTVILPCRQFSLAIMIPEISLTAENERIVR